MTNAARRMHESLLFLVCSVAAAGGCTATESHRLVEPLVVSSRGSIYTGPKYTAAIGRIDNRSAYMRGIFFGDTDRLGLQLRQILKTHLNQTGRFDLVDRVNMERLAREAELSGRPQHLVGSEIIITGAVTEFGRKEVGSHALGGVLGRSRSQVAYAKISLTIVDVLTSRALYSVQGAGEYELTAEVVLGFGSSAPYDATLNDKVLNLAVIDVVNKLVASLERGEWKPGAPGPPGKLQR